VKTTLYAKKLPILLILPVFLILLAACSGAGSSQGELKMAAMEGMPDEVQSAPVTVRQAYQFAVANPTLLQQIPCYCGCGAMGHTSNFACYVSDVDLHGNISYDPHALGCSICVDITQDTMRLTQQGKSLPEIRAFVDQTYAQYGSSNIP
jgi:Protein of unknown function with PCYCGC motif